MTFRISVELSHQCPLDEIRQHAAILEAHDFFRVWVPDTLVSPWEAWLAAGLIAHTTRRIHIGVGVTNPYTRHPVVMAQMAATFQHLSNGRLAMAMGKGIQRFLEKAGITQHLSAVEECVLLLRRLIAGERTTLSGNAYNIDGIQLRTSPPEKKVPVFLAAVGPKTWETALAAADGITTFWSPQAAEINRRIKAAHTLHTAAMIPFSLTQSSFFRGTVTSSDELKHQMAAIKEAGFDEGIVAYGTLGDLKSVAQLT